MIQMKNKTTIKICKECKKEFFINYYFHNARKYCSDICHKEAHNKSSKKYNRKNKQKRKDYNKKYYQTHRKLILKSQKQYREKNKKQLKVKRIKNKEKLRLNFQKWLKNPINRLIYNYRIRLSHVLSSGIKDIPTLKLIGCTIEFLKNHLEKQFTKGMSWSNYGKWHVDHIKQCCLFNLSKKSEQFKCFNYKNLRPLWAKDNFKRPKR